MVVLPWSVSVYLVLVLFPVASRRILYTSVSSASCEPNLYCSGCEIGVWACEFYSGSVQGSDELFCCLGGIDATCRLSY